MPEDTAATVDAAASGKVWTQEEHDAYVKSRIDKQNAKNAEAIAAKDARIAELEAQAKEQADKLHGFEAQQQRAQWAQEVEQETGIPAAVLRGDSLDELKAHAEALKAVIRPYPSINPAAIPNEGMQAPKLSRADVLGIKDARQRIAAMRENPALFPEIG